MSDSLTHLDKKGHAHMVDVSQKAETVREAVAMARVSLGEKAFNLLMEGGLPKGDALAAARIAGIMGAKKVPDLVPLCHSIPLHAVEIDFSPDETTYSLGIQARAKSKGVTGVEMEALTAVSIAALTIYDMCKAVEKGIVIQSINLEFKSGGKSGTWLRKK
jgi:cyclic pyranopterin phosphate synthase